MNTRNSLTRARCKCESREPQTLDQDFVAFATQATDAQLTEILHREWRSPGHRNYMEAREAAHARGWTVSAGRRIG